MWFSCNCIRTRSKNFKKLKKNVKLNKSKNINLINSAIYTKNSILKFTRVKDNLTGSHISKRKKSYGRKRKIFLLKRLISGKLLIILILLKWI